MLAENFSYYYYKYYELSVRYIYVIYSVSVYVLTSKVILRKGLSLPLCETIFLF